MRKRSKYRPKGVFPDPINWVLSGMKKMNDLSAGTTLRIKNHDALDSVRRGEATRVHIDTLIGAFNITEALGLAGVGAEYQEDIRAAQDALLAVGRRGASTGKFVLTGPELQALNLGMEIHEAQLEVCTVKMVEDAIDYVEKMRKARKMRPIVVKEAV